MSMRDEVKVRCTAEQKARWQEVAGESGLSEWLRELADAACVRSGLENLFDARLPVVGAYVGEGDVVRDEVTGEAYAVTTLSTNTRRLETCAHGRPAFLFCGACDA